MHVCKDQRPKTKDQRPENGFTPIELSIVIVIIGLIVAGVVGGQALVEQAKLRRLVLDIKKYELAINTFRLEYNALPADFRRASDFGLGVSGNGDREVSHGPGAYESVCTATHLSNAGLIEGTYTCSGFNTSSMPTVNYSDQVTLWVLFGGQAKAGGDQHFYVGLPVGIAPYQAYRNDNFIHVGEFTAPSSGRMINGFLTPKDSQGIDNKIDDGEPGSGKMLISRGWYEAAGTCTDKNIIQTLPVTMNFSDTGKTCRLLYNIGK